MISFLGHILKHSSCLNKYSSGAILFIRAESTNGSRTSRMVVGAFPLARLVFTVVYRITRPLANGIVTRAQKSEAFRNYICIPLGQSYYWLDVKVRMRLLNLGKATSFPKLDDKKAIELGAQLILEFIIVVVFSVITIYEHNRSSEKEEEKRKQRDLHNKEVNDRIKYLECALQKQSAQLKNVAYLLNAMREAVS